MPEYDDPFVYKALEGSLEDLPKSYNGLARLFGYPVYTSKWMPDTMIVMGNRGGKTLALKGWEYAQRVAEEQRMSRPYGNLTGSDLSRVLAEQIRAGGPIQPPTGTTLEATTGQNVETIFRVGPDGRPEAVTRLVDAPSKGAARNGGESEIAWLKRRVNEICWRPA